MKKIRLYLDTSVISALDDPKKPERMKETYLFWEEVKAGKYEIVLSSVVADEINKCKQPKRDNMFTIVNTIGHKNILVNETIREIAEEIIKLKILKKKHRDDCLHIGSAIFGECDCIVSWNFRHLVNYKTIRGVRVVTGILNYKNIDILSPTMMISKEK